MKMTVKRDIKQYLEFLDDEKSSALLYETLAEIETDSRLAEVYRRIAEVELQHADVWERKIREAGGTVPEFRPSWRVRIMQVLARRFGSSMVLPTIQQMELSGVDSYDKQPGAASMGSQERSHAMLLTHISNTTSGGIEGGVLAQLEGRHRSTGGNALRAAVMGANDGLVSNLSLVMGVAGATMDSRTVLITGLAGMLAGSISMALGEWLSVQSSRELYTHQIEVERAEIEEAPEEETEELALIYEARGLKPEQARILANQIMENKEQAVETMVREELGIDPEELGGSAWEAAVTSFVLFTLGAIIPVISFTFLSGLTAVIVSIIFSMFGLFLLGAAITLFTGRTVLYSGARMVLFGLAAAALTFAIGRLIGVSIA